MMNNMMNNEMFKKMISFNQTVFENGFKAMESFQDQTEKMVANFVQQVPFIPEEGKKVTLDMFKNYKKVGEDFKRTLEGNLKKGEDFWSSAK
jgi:hypothetical protein